MHVLLGNRFLKWFAGDLKSRQKRWAILLKDQNPDADKDRTIGSDSPASEEDNVNKFSNGHDLQNDEEQYKMNETETRNE